MTDNTRGGSRFTSNNESVKHEDFQAPWIQEMLQDPDATLIEELPPTWGAELVNNTMFNYTLAHDAGLRARVLFRRPCKESDSATGTEDCFLLSVGQGLDGAKGRAHGGLSSVIMDHLLGTCAHREASATAPPATATLTVDYRNPIATPCVVLARAWMLKESVGRKVWLRGVLEDGRGKTYAEAKALFVVPKDGKVKL